MESRQNSINAQAGARRRRLTLFAVCQSLLLGGTLQLFAGFPVDAASGNNSSAGWTTVDQLLKVLGESKSESAIKDENAIKLASENFKKANRIANLQSTGNAKKTANSISRATVSTVGSGPAAASSYIDYQEMSGRALGKKDWETLSPAQKREFSKSLQVLVEKRYYPRWRKIFGKGKVRFIDESSVAGDTVVRTELLLGKKVEPLYWKLSERGGVAKVVSLSVSGKDLLDKLSQRIQSKRKKGQVNIDALIAWMRNAGDIGATLEAASLQIETD